MNLKASSILRILEFLILIGLIGFMLWWRFQVAQIRFFDVDEFTHMHWAANMARGQKPYVDFFTFFTPGFYWLLMPLFWIYQRNPNIFLAARTLIFINFMGIAALTGALFSMLRSKRFALLPVILLMFLPMPYDKFLEIRPDNVSTLLALAGVVLEVYALLHKESKTVHRMWLSAGICYAVSLVVLVKTLPFVAMGFLIAFIDAGVWEWFVQCIKKRRIVPFAIHKNHLMFVMGFGGVVVLFILWLLSLGHFSTVWYSLTRLAFEGNTIGRVYIMEPHLFFFPNASFYGGWGITEPLITNHTIWLFGAAAGSFRFLTPFIAGEGKKERVLSEILISSIFIFSVVGYVAFFPLKHSQYLIPIAIFIAWYAADLLVAVFTWVSHRMGTVAVIILLILMACILGRDTIQVDTNKLPLSNTVQLEQTRSLLRMIPPSESVLDLDGRLMYWKDPYYICCLPFGSFVRFLSRPPAPLSQVLEEKKVPYIFQGDSGRLWELWNDLPYINAHYERVPGWGDALWKRKNL